MDPDVRDAWKHWRQCQHHVEQLVDRMVQRRSALDDEEFLASEEDEFLARRRYYRLLQERHGLPLPHDAPRELLWG